MLKRIVLLISILLLFLPSCLHAEQGASLSLSWANYQDQDVESSPIVKVIYDWKDFYLFGSYERPTITAGGQQVCAVDLFGGGVGVKKIFGNFIGRLDLGYYYPDVNIHDDGGTYVTFNEAMTIYLNKAVYPFTRTHDLHNYSMTPGVGGSLSIGYSYEFGNNWSIGLTTSYRYLRLKGTGKGFKTNIENDPGWEVPLYKDFSGFQGGFILTKRF